MAQKKVLIANRGVIATRIIRTLKKLGHLSVAIFSEADRHSQHVDQADEAVCIGGARAADSYLKMELVLEVAQKTGAHVIHPGYGFLSENADFSDACDKLGIAFAGPTPEQIRAFGLKHTARELAQKAGVPMLPGTGLLSSVEEAVTEAEKIRYPVMLKSTAGGGGIGMRLCWNEKELRDAFDAVKRLGEANFKNAGLYLEKYVQAARHLEVQLFGDGKGRVVTLGERDCSAQRRNQKVIEETPAPGLTEEQRAMLADSARRLAESVKYRGAGTVEYVYDGAEQQAYFLEVNTRLQVEHGVTEEVWGVDLVEWMIRLALGENLDAEFDRAEAAKPQGHSIQVRVYAEDPAKNFQPCSGTLTGVKLPGPELARVETWVERGVEVTPYYDPMVAKIIVHADSREAAVLKLQKALEQSALDGIECNLEYLRAVLKEPVFAEGKLTTSYLNTFRSASDTIDVVQPGTFSTLQDYPGRLGYWDVGVPPSGPMDSLTFRVANRLVGNAANAVALELTLNGPILKFNAPAVIALCGAEMAAKLDGHPLPQWQPVEIAAGSVLKIAGSSAGGARAYLSVRGGFRAPDYLGSRSTFTLGQFGGHAGRVLRAGDVLHLAHEATESEAAALAGDKPQFPKQWEIAVLHGPHAAPDFFQEEDIRDFYSTDWEVHYNSSRTGVRLIGPKPRWARADGGEAGLHPSNIHDNAYAIGAIDFTGDMPIILGPDGPSLGGFVCPAVVVQGELWKTGQLKAGDRVRFIPVTEDEAARLQSDAEEAVRAGRFPTAAPQKPVVSGVPPTSAILQERAAEKGAPRRICRPAGDGYLLVEYGPLQLDLELRFRVHALMLWLQKNRPEGIIDITPGIRSLQLHYDAKVLPRKTLLALLDRAEEELGSVDELEVDSRIVHLPLSWDDEQTQLAIRKYMQSVRPDAPWCPSNLEFIRRINGLSSIDDVKRIVFDASYLVMGLGDVYLGAPVATPVDPRHRLVTTKYNPARTWTPENAVGIGGAYMCIYGMEGPGGYQFVGRTVQVWNRYRQTADFTEGKPWLLRFFDQIRFYPVSGEELLELREKFIHGQFHIQVENTKFRLAEYKKFLASIATEAAEFKATQSAAFEEERKRWEAAGQLNTEPEAATAAVADEEVVPEGCEVVSAPASANVWQIHVKPGDTLEEDGKLLTLEAMKMEIAVLVPSRCEVVKVLAVEGRPVNSGQTLAFVRPL